MWTLLGFAALVLMFMFWYHSDAEPEMSITAPNASASCMNATLDVPAGINSHHTITYRITRWDLFANMMTIWLRNRILQVMVPILLLWHCWNHLSDDFRSGSWREIPGKAIIVVLIFLGGLIGAMVLMALIMSFLLKQRGIVGQHMLEITEEGLIERTDFNQTLHKWPSICRIMTIFGYLFIYVGDQNSHQVPKGRVPPGQMADFEAELRARATALDGKRNKQTVSV